MKKEEGALWDNMSFLCACVKTFYKHSITEGTQNIRKYTLTIFQSNIPFFFLLYIKVRDI
jgi:hypothetical protein